MNRLKRSVLICGLIIATIGAWSAWASPADAATEANWARNAESDLSHYRVYACFTKGCTVTQSGPMLQAGTIAQTAAGVRPKWNLPVGQEGSLAISAVDTSANESGISVPVPFDTKPPLTPADVQTQ